MSAKRLLRIAAYGAWFGVMFVVGVYLTFPINDMRGMLVAAAEDTLGKGKQGAYGVDPHVTVDRLSLSGFGVKASRVAVQLASRDPDPGPTIDLDSVRVGIRPFSLLGKARTISFSADLYGGSVDGTVSLDDKGALYDADIDIDELDVSKVPLLLDKLGVPGSGKISGSVVLDLGATPEKTGEGKVVLDLEGLSVGPGNLKLAAAFGGFEAPQIDLGKLTGTIKVKQGQGTLENVRLEGKDVVAALEGNIYLRGHVGTSRMDIDGNFQPTPSFLEREKKIQSLLELGESMGGGSGPSLGKAKDDEGHYHFSIKGSVQSPLFSLARDNGKRAKQKAGRSGPAPTAPPAEQPE